MSEEDLPFSPALPKSRKKRRFPLMQAIVDSIVEWSFKPLLNYGRSEWKSVKKYPGFIVFVVLTAVALTWYCARFWYLSLPYTGETVIKLFFPGGDQSPVLVYQTNIYRYTCYRGDFHITSPGMDANGKPIAT